MSKNLSAGHDKGQGVKKYNSDGSTNKEWKAIHYGTPMPKGAQSSHGIAMDEEDEQELNYGYDADDDDAIY